MKVFIIILFCLVHLNAHAQPINSVSMTVKSIESRESAMHDIHFNGIVPDQGCTLSDRAILDESLPGGSAMFSVLLSALMSDKSVVIRVDGCAGAPKIIKVQLYR